MRRIESSKGELRCWAFGLWAIALSILWWFLPLLYPCLGSQQHFPFLLSYYRANAYVISFIFAVSFVFIILFCMVVGRGTRRLVCGDRTQTSDNWGPSSGRRSKLRSWTKIDPCLCSRWHDYALISERKSILTPLSSCFVVGSPQILKCSLHIALHPHRYVIKLTLDQDKSNLMLLNSAVQLFFQSW